MSISLIQYALLKWKKCRNWQGLAGLCKIHANYEASIVNNPDPTSKVLNLWQTQDPDSSTIKQFILFLEEMDRFDVVTDIDELIGIKKKHLFSFLTILI